MQENTGRAVLRTYLNVIGLPISAATAFFDATTRAGQAMDLAMRIRRHGQLSYEQLKVYGELSGLRESDPGGGPQAVSAGTAGTARADSNDERRTTHCNRLRRWTHRDDGI
jgi:hypothetical protein